jgi:hypothetical protein
MRTGRRHDLSWPDKWCAGSCGRLLPRSAYYPNGLGIAQGRCKGCHRVACRLRARKLYRYSAAFRERERARAARRYYADTEYRRAQIGRASERKRLLRAAAMARREELAS